MENKKEDVKSQPDESTVTKEHGEKEMEELPWIQYFYPKMISDLMHKKYLVFGALVFFYYIV